MGVFKSYDIRGIYPDELDEELAYNLGRASALFFKSKKIGVGRDCRLSSPALAKSLIYGITDQGVGVVDLGLVSTPCAYFASRKFPTIMVTASHNPAEFNGFKFTGRNLMKIGSCSGLERIRELVLKKDFPAARKKGFVKPLNIIPAYSKKIRGFAKRLKPLRVLFDTGNGMGGIVLPELLKQTCVKYKILYKELDGTFPNHLADPVKPENTAELQKKVVSEKYDFGVAYDADCDRVRFIDEKGNRIRSEYALVILANYLCRNCRVVKTVSCSKIIDRLFKRVYLSAVGHVHVAKVMRDNDCDIGAEVSGHFFFRNFWYADSGDAAVMCMLGALSKAKKPLSSLVGPLESVYANSEEINIKVKNQDKAIARVEKAFRSARINKLDGLSIDAGDFWFNLRKSNTEAVLRLNAEAKNKKLLDACIRRIKSLAR